MLGFVMTGVVVVALAVGGGAWFLHDQAVDATAGPADLSSPDGVPAGVDGPETPDPGDGEEFLEEPADGDGSTGDGVAAFEGSGTLARIQQDGVLVVGFAGEEPYSYQENGELKGATIALLESAFSELGVTEVRAVQADWAALIPGLNAGRYDVISAGMSILPERCEQAEFSHPEMLYTTALMVPSGNPESVHDLHGIADAGLTVAVLDATLESSYATTLGLDSLDVGSLEEGMDAVIDGRADAFAANGVSLRVMAADAPGTTTDVTDSFVAVIDGQQQIGAGATVFRSDDDALREAYNEEIDEIVGDKEAFLDAVGEFGFTEAERPKGSVTTEGLCGGE